MPDGLPGPLSLHEIRTSPSLSVRLLAVEGGEREGGRREGGREGGGAEGRRRGGEDSQYS